MFDQERPGTISQDEDHEKAREDIEEMLDMIYKEKSESESNLKRYREMIENSRIVDTNEENPSIFPGRYVTKVVCVFPLEVSKRFVRPCWSSDENVESSADFIIRKLFGIEKLGNLLLLITPTAITPRNVEKYIVHCYTVDTQWHLGVTSLIGRERDLIKNEENPEKYSVIFSSSYIELEDAFMPTSLKGQLFDVLRKRSIDATKIWYKNNRITLQYWSSDPERYAEDEETIPAVSTKRSVAGKDKVLESGKNAQVLKPIRRVNLTLRHVSPTSVQDTQSRIRKESYSCTSQQQRHPFTHSPIQTRNQKKPKNNDKAQTKASLASSNSVGTNLKSRLLSVRRK